MPKIKNKEKAYVILDKNGYIYGAFPFTEEGKSMAEKHRKKIQQKGEELIVEER
jgi:hypothetical protein